MLDDPELLIQLFRRRTSLSMVWIGRIILCRQQTLDVAVLVNGFTVFVSALVSLQDDWLVAYLAGDFLRRATGHKATPRRETAFHRVYTCVRQRTHKNASARGLSAARSRKSNSPGSMAAHPCNKRKDGAPSVGIADADIIRGGRPGPPATHFIADASEIKSLGHPPAEALSAKPNGVAFVRKELHLPWSFATTVLSLVLFLAGSQSG